MDALALLCNLHADGPATLQRLRRSGCESLATLRRVAPATLAEWLEWNERAAERFLREAVLLSARVEDEGLEDDADDPAAEHATLAETESEEELYHELGAEDAGPEGEEFEDEGEDEEAEEELEDDGAGHVPPLERVQAVLGAWRELDRVAPPSDPADFVIPRPAPVADEALRDVELEGLSPQLVARLAELGVRTLRELAQARELELARALPLGFTRVKHLQFLAARVLERLPVPEASAPQAPVFEAFTPPPSEPFETAGPFA